MKKIYIEKNIKFLRKNKNVTQRTVMFDLNITGRMASQFENISQRKSNEKIKLEMMIKLTEYYNVNIENLIFSDIENEEKTKITEITEKK